MANDYLNIRCTFCGAHKWIAKYYPGSMETYKTYEHVTFYREHFECNPSVIETDTHLSNGSGFEILTDDQMAKYRKEESLDYAAFKRERG